MGKVYIATRLDSDDYRRVEELSRESKLGRAEIVRRLVLIGLKRVQKPEDLLKL